MRIDQFKGLNNQQAPTEFGLDGMVQAQNVDITDAFKLRLRNGKGSRVATASIQAACATGEGEVLYQVGDTMYLMDNGPVLSRSIKQRLSVTNFLTCAKVNNDIVWSNGVQRGYIRAGEAFDFIETRENPPAGQFNGLMPPGDYMYAVTYNDANGFEYSCGAGNSIQITQGGIEVELFNLTSDITHANLYLTHANGSILYHAVRLDVRPIDGAVPTHIMYAGNTTDLATPISNQFCDTPPAFSMAGFYKGRMYYAVDNILYASKPFNYHLVDMAVDFVMFPAMIQLMMPAESGIYVVTSTETVFLSGTDPQDFASNKVLDYGGTKGTGKRIYASTINPQQAGNVWLWASNRGLIGGFDDGSVSNLTDQVFAFPNSIGGTSALREENGLRQLLITL